MGLAALVEIGSSGWNTRQFDTNDELASKNAGIRERRWAGLKIYLCSLSPTRGIASKHF
jgi:hypothetical protein